MPINSFLYPAPSTPTFAYDVANSCRFESAYLNKSVTASSSTSWTLSFWIKIHSHSSSAEGYLWSCGSSSAGQGFYISTTSYLGYYGGSGYGSDSSVTNGVLRDPSAWYHVVFKVSSGTGTTYINGTQQTGTVSSVAPLNAHTGDEMTVNTYTADKAGYDDCKCSLAEYCFIDGTAYSASDFGEFDEDSPRIWKPKDVSGLTFGTNGFYLDFEDSSALGDDAKGSFDFTVNSIAATDQATDTPTNSFCTMNPLYPDGTITFSEGNLKLTNSTSWRSAGGTMAVSTGKWFWEVSNVGNYAYIGFADIQLFSDGCSIRESFTTAQATTGRAHSVGSNDGRHYQITSGGAQSSEYPSSATFSTYAGNIIGIALNLDDNEFTLYKDGTAMNSGTAVSIATGTYIPAVSIHGTNLSMNFGSPAFTISSGNADGNGYGNFEYAVPTNYYSLCTKNLAEFG